ncbi:rhodopsin [Biomphalaria pfeifferi]|uniref:Rhodopsin n=1 Tax=Biomphalaria pfeifferi TaxID=112525 RepID=A0AAD8F7N5_BIOPF|nr:rhodopsin [Biomphalaria pfeifferi]
MFGMDKLLMESFCSAYEATDQWPLNFSQWNRTQGDGNSTMTSVISVDSGNCNKTYLSIDETWPWLAYILTIISDGIVDYYLWAICAVGVPGNILTILVVLTMEAVSPASILVATLSMCDLLTLGIKFIGMQFYLLRISVGTSGCIISMALGMFLGSMANWSLILISGERCIAVCFPLKRGYLLTKGRVCNTIAAMSATLLAISLTTSILTVDEVTGEWYCSPDVEHGVFYWVIGTLYVNVPFVSITFLTSAVLRGLRLSGKRHARLIRQATASDKADPRQTIANRAEVTLTTMMVASALLFQVLFLPALIVPLVFNPPADDITVEAQWRLFSEIRYLLLDLSHALNFFLYFVTAKKFRSHVIKLLSVSYCLHTLRRRICLRGMRHLD